jgi:hypothetical protein
MRPGKAVGPPIADEAQIPGKGPLRELSRLRDQSTTDLVKIQSRNSPPWGIVVACWAMDLPEVVTPDELAKRCGWSVRRVRNLARQLGACRILGHRMVLTKEDVAAVLEATKPKPLSVPVPRQMWRAGPSGDYAELLKLRERTEKPKRPRQPRGRLPRSKLKGEV